MYFKISHSTAVVCGWLFCIGQSVHRVFSLKNVVLGQVHMHCVPKQGKLVCYGWTLDSKHTPHNHCIMYDVRVFNHPSALMALLFYQTNKKEKEKKKGVL